MYLRSGALAVALLLGGCAGGPPKPGPESLDLEETPNRPEATSTASDPRDPFQGANRAMWAVNYDVLEPYVARPVVHGYARYVPQGMKDGIDNLVENFDEPSSMVNHLITGDLKGAGTNLGRFTLNTTIGLLGIFDVAKHAGLERNMLEMDTVLGRADIGDGAYIMMPVYGPTTTREFVGDTIDTLYFPYALLTFPLRVVHWALDGLGTRAKLIDQERIIDNALDPYALTKDFYLQYNDGKVTGRQPELKQQKKQEDDSNLDEYLDEIDQ
ncbi:MlaA family lipoprotein [Aeromonas encheleia]|uniref:VacJ family lipoprotein n=1 Tax=Aeromonas encheleia TaxID=73010 RepID=A0AAE9MIE4_9GAMM|nr:VacJ family lipoprotein [Aeromonas encheleia]USV58724.1 VacJ family lipoprotein [Aeromonas encheleia]